MISFIVFDPLLPWMVIWAMAAALGAGIGFAAWRNLLGWPLRALAGLVILGALMGPVYQQEERKNLSDIVLLVEDQSASQTISDRAAVTANAADQLAAQLAARGNTDVRRILVEDAPDNAGTQVMSALAAALAEEPSARIAGTIIVSDGVVHDIQRTPDMPAPLHLLQTGHADDWDRRIEIRNAPAFAILNEEITLTIEITDTGAVPEGMVEVPLGISVDGAAPQLFSVPIGQPLDLPVTLGHGGRNVLELTTPMADGELTDRNNTALVQINGVRDRLSVLLVSGQPHPGGRTWRNLLKSDSSVDLVHFTILRPPEKQDGVPVGELSLIAFPTRELFLEKIDDFDLIIFDRYQRRGILPSVYLENVRNYVEQGGAILIAAGPDFAGAQSIYRSPLEAILPARPTARVIEEPFLPTVTDTGQRHPVTAGLQSDSGQNWGQWRRQIDLTDAAGQVVMSGHDDRPLLILDRVGQGRVALLASDHAWLWSRGYDGGGPQLELLRRLAHWMMKEPELEEEALWANAVGQSMKITRRTLADEAGQVTITSPSGIVTTLDLTEAAPGRFEAGFEGPEIGLYRLENGDHSAVIGLGPASPIEFETTIASAEALTPLAEATNGGVTVLDSSGLPMVRNVRPGRVAQGRGWIGITPRGAYETLNVIQVALLPAWLVLLMVTGFVLAGWLREGRR